MAFPLLFSLNNDQRFQNPSSPVAAASQSIPFSRMTKRSWIWSGIIKQTTSLSPKPTFSLAISMFSSKKQHRVCYFILRMDRENCVIILKCSKFYNVMGFFPPANIFSFSSVQKNTLCFFLLLVKLHDQIYWWTAKNFCLKE